MHRNRNEIDEAYRRGAERQRSPMRAIKARYDRRAKRIVVDLANGCGFAFPPELGQGIRGAPAAQLACIEIMPLGDVLHWPELDADLSVSAMMTGIFGGRSWMQEIGRAGGLVRSKAKAAAARRNGQKGGRPRKAVAVRATRAASRTTSTDA